MGPKCLDFPLLMFAANKLSQKGTTDQLTTKLRGMQTLGSTEWLNKGAGGSWGQWKMSGLGAGAGSGDSDVTQAKSLS